MFEYLLRFVLITLTLVGGLWALRWYIMNRWRPSRPQPIIQVVERAFLAQGRQGLVVDVGQQRFFIVLSDKHSSVTEIDYPDFAATLQEETEDADSDCR